MFGVDKARVTVGERIKQTLASFDDAPATRRDVFWALTRAQFYSLLETRFWRGWFLVTGSIALLAVGLQSTSLYVAAAFMPFALPSECVLVSLVTVYAPETKARLFPS